MRHDQHIEQNDTKGDMDLADGDGEIVVEVTYDIGPHVQIIRFDDDAEQEK
jgi:hypothetical protein